MITKNAVVEIQNLIVIHESRPAKSNIVYKNCAFNFINPLNTSVALT